MLRAVPLPFLFLLVVLFGGACAAYGEPPSKAQAPNPGPGAGPSTEAGPSPEQPPAAPDPVGSPGCTGAAPAAGESEHRVIAPDGRERIYHLHVPPNAGAGPLPMVLAFHGGAHTANGFDDFAHLREKSDEAGFVLVLPEGIGAIGARADGYAQTWNAGSCCAESVAQKVDDVGFVRVMLDEIESRLCVDRKRVFATGFSNGGMLSYRLACELYDRIAAIAPVGGGLGDDDRSVMPPTKHFECKPPRPIPVLHFHGTDDACYPIEGGVSPMAKLPGVPEIVTGGFESVTETIGTFLELGGCSANAPLVTYTKGRAECVAFQCPAPAHVEQCIIKGGGHYWPGGGRWPGARVFCGRDQGVRSDDIVANDKMWEFFRAHPMP